MQPDTYNGWRNYQTWDVALWLGNDEALYACAREHETYDDVRAALNAQDSTQTPDNVAWNDSALDTKALDEMVQEL